MKKLAIFLIVFLIALNVKTVFCFWAGEYAGANNLINTSIEVPNFVFVENSNQTFVVDEEFYLEYFEQIDGEFVWKDGLSKEQVEEIGRITKDYEYIKTDIVYKIRLERYHLLYNGLPCEDCFYLSWALEPIRLEIVEGWSYFTGRVITYNSVFYRAKYYANQTPLENPYAWERINSLSPTDFENFENTYIKDYNTVISEELIRPYNWSENAKYLKDDIVEFNNKQYLCIEENKGVLPSNNNFWKSI